MQGKERRRDDGNGRSGAEAGGRRWWRRWPRSRPGRERGGGCARRAKHGDGAGLYCDLLEEPGVLATPFALRKRTAAGGGGQPPAGGKAGGAGCADADHVSLEPDLDRLSTQARARLERDAHREPAQLSSDRSAGSAVLPERGAGRRARRETPGAGT